jgi:AraC family transcriptional regulator
MSTCSASLYGEVVKRGTIAGLALTETHYAKDLKLPKHSHGEPYFCFVLKGAYMEQYGRRSRSCQATTLIFHPADEIHADQFQAAARCFNIQIPQPWQERVRQCSLSLNRSMDFRGGFLQHLALRLYQEFHKGDTCSPLIVEGLALEMIGEMCRPAATQSPGVAPHWLCKARQLLHEQFPESLTLAEIARAVGVHPVHLARQFRRFYHCTMGEHLRRLRVEFACREIARSNLPLSEIALAAGFFDQSHFNKTFKLYTGITPKAYREMFPSR